MGKERRPRAGAARRAADDPAIAHLLDAVREVRTTLAIDLSATAGALEENQPEVARDILAATSGELSRLSLEPAPTPSTGAAKPRHSRRSRVLLALPAVPLVGAIAMTTAAAISGDSKPPSHRVVAETAGPLQHTPATTTLRRLEHAVLRHARAAQVIAVADDLHKQLTRMIATSTNDPAQLHVVQQLLTLEQHVLEGSKVPGTQLALAASRAIAELLEHRPVHTQSKHSLSTHATARPAPTAQPAPATTQRPTHVGRAPQQHQPTSTTHTSPSPNPTSPLFGGGFFNPR